MPPAPRFPSKRKRKGGVWVAQAAARFRGGCLRRISWGHANHSGLQPQRVKLFEKANKHVKMERDSHESLAVHKHVLVQRGFRT